MQLSTVILSIVASAASGASAYELPPHPTLVARAVDLQARGTPECTSAASSLLPRITDFPLPPSEVEEYLATAEFTITDACKDPEITGDIGSQFSSWASEYTSWQQSHISDFRALWQACSDVPEVASVVPTGTDACSSVVAAITSNPGPRETGAIAAAALFAAGAAAAAL